MTEKFTYTAILIYMLSHRWDMAHDPILCIMSLTVAVSDASALGPREKGSLGKRGCILKDNKALPRAQCCILAVNGGDVASV